MALGNCRDFRQFLKPTTHQELPMIRLTLNPHNPTGPLWLCYLDIVTRQITFLGEVM